MLAGLKEGQIKLVSFDNERGVSVSTNESDVVGWTADEILRGFLEVSNPTDYATAEKVERLQELRRMEKLSPSEKEGIGKFALGCQYSIAWWFDG